MSATCSELRRLLLYGAIAVFFLIAICSFLLEDFLHPVGPTNDLSVPWVATRAYLAGKNPYSDYTEFEKIWAETGITGAHGCLDYRCILDFYTFGYPPTALALFSPLGVLPLRIAVWVEMYGSVAALIVVLLMAAAKLGYEWRDPRTLYFLGFVLALAPLHGGIHNSNPNTLMLALLLGGALLLYRSPSLAGIAFAVVFCIKPQLAILFCAYPVLRRMWKVVAAEAATVLVIGAVTVGWMDLHHVAWFSAYREAIATFTNPNGPSSFTGTGSGTFHMIHLPVLAYQMTHSASAASAISWVIFLALAGTAAVLIYRRINASTEWLGLAMVAVLTLLPIYQRFYSASVLAFATYWAVENWSNGIARAVRIVMLPLLIPFVTLTMEARPAVSFIAAHHLSSSWMWNSFVMPYTVWIELATAVLLLVQLSRISGRIPDGFSPRRAEEPRSPAIPVDR